MYQSILQSFKTYFYSCDGNYMYGTASLGNMKNGI